MGLPIVIYGRIGPRQERARASTSSTLEVAAHRPRAAKRIAAPAPVCTRCKDQGQGVPWAHDFGGLRTDGQTFR